LLCAGKEPKPRATQRPPKNTNHGTAKPAPASASHRATEDWSMNAKTRPGDARMTEASHVRRLKPRTRFGIVTSTSEAQAKCGPSLARRHSSAFLRCHIMVSGAPRDQARHLYSRGRGG